MWLVNQIEGEYNPVHLHTRCSISAVMYLKIPEYEERRIPNKRTQDGDITFVYKSAGDPVNSFERSLLSLKPEVGRMYMFPSTLLHTVYPFLGNGNRVSVSFNFKQMWKPGQYVAPQGGHNNRGNLRESSL